MKSALKIYLGRVSELYYDELKTKIDAASKASAGKRALPELLEKAKLLTGEYMNLTKTAGSHADTAEKFNANLEKNVPWKKIRDNTTKLITDEAFRTAFGNNAPDEAMSNLGKIAEQAPTDFIIDPTGIVNEIQRLKAPGNAGIQNAGPKVNHVQANNEEHQINIMNP